jgi:hypothetical protein
LLDQKKKKSSSTERLLCHEAFALQSGKTTGCKMLLHFVRSLTPALQQLLLCLCHAQATIVLPDFARSCSADEGNKKNH